MYNIKLLTYPDKTQRLYFYESLMDENHDSKPDRQLNPFDGEWARVESCSEPVSLKRLFNIPLTILFPVLVRWFITIPFQTNGIGSLLLLLIRKILKWIVTITIPVSMQ